ncbi:hypothetical protein PHYPSEUDO_001723 [Phytophthora pseudosyringae]|uniref:Uncharacterized protein n=1 Tax=Phytophthora pseudosyringae TaxID=221518 RepID=A0A8T1W022_9STRA|nr:hypothetical protein PHYPSEUDO_001723 [Phytophthora pseudosyringae]
MNSSSNTPETPEPHHINDPAKDTQTSKVLSKSSIVMLVMTLVLAGVVACDVAMETNIVSSSWDPVLPSKYTNSGNDDVREPTCSPSSVNLSNIEYHSDHRYYSILNDMTPLPPPVFRGDHTVLCNDSYGKDLSYEYCLPLSGRKDAPFCTGADRMDLLAPHSNQTRCYASVLHMLLVEVYEVLHAFNKTPIVVFGSLLGAIRNGSMIPFTEDTDIAYSGQLETDDNLGRALMAKGYHFFPYGIWRVCVAPTHPLASRLYDPTMPISGDYAVPYLDLYAMEKLNETDWSMEEFNNRILPAKKVEPFSQVTINGLRFDTVHDPNYFLVKMYGDDYMTPKPRE